MPAHENRIEPQPAGEKSDSAASEDLFTLDSADAPVVAGTVQETAATAMPATRTAIPGVFMSDFVQGDLSGKRHVAYTIKLPSDQLAALQSIWLELKRLYGTHSPDKSGMIQLAIAEWLRRWDGPERAQLLQDLLDIREDTRRRQYRK